jgi:hypothetical protein
MHKLYFTGSAFSDDLQKGIEQFSGHFNFTVCKDGLKVEIVHTDRGLKLSKNGDSAVIGFNRKIEFFRALGYLFQHMDKPSIDITEESQADLLGVIVKAASWCPAVDVVNCPYIDGTSVQT